jgi:hypothetical protein
MAFDGMCNLGRVGVEPSGRAQLELSAADGSFPSQWFLSKAELNREIFGDRTCSESFWKVSPLPNTRSHEALVGRVQVSSYLILLCQIKMLASDHVGKYNVMC